MLPLVRRVSPGYPNAHADPRARKKDSILVQYVLQHPRILDPIPSGPDKTSDGPWPAYPIDDKAATPTHSDPVKFKPLAFEFGRSNFKLG